MNDDETLERRVRSLHEHLAATQERPVERSASRWIGEAEAVASDLVDADVTEATLAERLGHVRHLLAEVAGTEDDAADEHVAAARDTTDALLDDLDVDADE